MGQPQQSSMPGQMKGGPQQPPGSAQLPASQAGQGMNGPPMRFMGQQGGPTPPPQQVVPLHFMLYVLLNQIFFSFILFYIYNQTCS
jgi:hypothetical protein